MNNENMTPYNERDHMHCFQSSQPPCGIKGLHRCCLCQKPVPSLPNENLQGEWEKEFEDQFGRPLFEEVKVQMSSERDTMLISQSQIKSFISHHLSLAHKEAFKEAIKIVSTHEEGENLGYCDTGSDMELWCRSDCVEMARERLEKRLSALTDTK